MQVCTIVNEDGSVRGTYLVSACNEIVNFTNINTGEIDFKIYDEEALHG